MTAAPPLSSLIITISSRYVKWSIAALLLERGYFWKFFLLLPNVFGIIFYCFNKYFNSMMISVRFRVRFTFYEGFSNNLFNLLIFFIYCKNFLLFLFLLDYNILVLQTKFKFVFNKLHCPFVNECLEIFIILPLGSFPFLNKFDILFGYAAVGLQFSWRPRFHFLNRYWNVFEVQVLMLGMNLLLSLWEFDFLLGVLFSNLQCLFYIYIYF